MGDGVMICCAFSKEEAFALFSLAIKPAIVLDDIHEQASDFIYIAKDGWVKDIELIKKVTN